MPQEQPCAVQEELFAAMETLFGSSSVVESWRTSQTHGSCHHTEKKILLSSTEKIIALNSLVGRLRDAMHVGPTGLMGILNDVLGAKNLTKYISKFCVKFQRFYARTTDQLMGQLPPSGVTPAHTFTTKRS